MEQRRIALIPAYEPDEKMLALLPQLTAAGLAVVVVDDGSGVYHLVDRPIEKGLRRLIRNASN